MTTTTRLAANGRLARSIAELFPNAVTAGFQGALVVSAAVLEQDGAKLAALPVEHFPIQG